MIAVNPPTVSFDDVMQDERAIYKWLQNIVYISTSSFAYLIHKPQDQYGFCFVQGVPATLEDTEALSRRISFIRETQCKLVFSSALGPISNWYQQMADSGISPPI